MGNTEGNIDVDVNKEGDVCLTCGARARSVGVREIVRTGQSRSADASRVTTRDAVSGRRSSKGEWPGLAQIESSSGAGRSHRRSAGCCGQSDVKPGTFTPGRPRGAAGDVVSGKR